MSNSETAKATGFLFCCRQIVSKGKVNQRLRNLGHVTYFKIVQILLSLRCLKLETSNLVRELFTKSSIYNYKTWSEGGNRSF